MVGRGIKPQGSPESMPSEKSGLGGGAKCCALDEKVISPQIQNATVLKECTWFIGAKCYQFAGMRETPVKAPRRGCPTSPIAVLKCVLQKIGSNPRPNFHQLPSEVEPEKGDRTTQLLTNQLGFNEMSKSEEINLRSYFGARRSASKRSLKGPGPSTQHLHEILKLACRTPDYGNLTPWRFVIVRSPALQALETKVQDSLHPNSTSGTDRPQIFFDTPCLVVVIGCNKPHEKITDYEQDLCVGAVCMNLLHAVNAYGYDGVWLTGKVAKDPVFRNEMNLQADEKVAGIIYLGSTTDVREDRPRPDISSLAQDYCS